MGLFAWVPLAGTAIGAGYNAHDNWDDWRSGKMSTGDHATSVGLGAATGALSTLGGGIGTTLLMGAGAAAGNEAGNQMIKRGKVDELKGLAMAGTSGLVGAGLGAIGSKFGKNFARITPPKTIPVEPLKDGSKLGGIIGSTVGSEASPNQFCREKTRGKII